MLFLPNERPVVDTRVRNATSSNEEILSSFFDLTMKDQIQQSIVPALHFLQHVLLRGGHQQSFANMKTKGSWSILAAMLLIERYYLNKYGALASEYFCGMKRLRLLRGGETAAPLRQQDRLATLLWMVCLPFLKDRLDIWYEAAKEDADLVDQVGSSNNRQGNFAMKIYPYFHGCYQSIFLLYKWKFLFQKTNFCSPLSHILKSIVCNVTAQDTKKNVQDSIIKSQKSGGRNFFQKVSNNSHLIAIAGLIAYRMLQWSFSPQGEAAEDVTRSVVNNLPPPELPAKSEKVTKALILSRENKCPLCEAPRQNPAASISGFVFCYPCIFRYVEEWQKCPVTDIECRISSVRRIYNK